MEGDERGDVVVIEGLVEGGGEHAGLEAGGAKDGEFGEGDSFDGVEFLVVDGPVAGDCGGGEAFEVVWGFDAEDGVAGGETVPDGIAGGADLAIDGARSGGFLRVGAIGGDLTVRCHCGSGSSTATAGSCHATVVSY